MEFNDYLKALAEAVGAGEALVPDANGVVALELDGMFFSMLDLSEAHQIVFLGSVGEVSPGVGDRAGLQQTLLEANYNFGGTGGASLSLHPHSGEISLCRALDVRAMDAEEFLTTLEAFVNTQRNWHEIVASYRGAEVRSDGPVSDGVPNPMLSSYICV